MFMRRCENLPNVRAQGLHNFIFNCLCALFCSSDAVQSILRVSVPLHQIVKPLIKRYHPVMQHAFVSIADEFFNGQHGAPITRGYMFPNNLSNPVKPEFFQKRCTGAGMILPGFKAPGFCYVMQQRGCLNFRTIKPGTGLIERTGNIQGNRTDHVTVCLDMREHPVRVHEIEAFLPAGDSVHVGSLVRDGPVFTTAHHTYMHRGCKVKDK